MGSFKDVVGHRDVIQYLQNAVAENRVSQAYIVNGERGTGKKMLAKLFAMALLCEEHGPEPPALTVSATLCALFNMAMPIL